MRIRFWMILFVLAASASNSFSQDATPDSTKLNGLKQYPKKNSLPVRQPILQIQPVQIPVSELDLKVNYWRSWLTFGVNLNQGSFSNNWSGGGVNSLALGSIFNYKTDYTKGDKNYVSEIILQYGKVKNKNQLQRKTTDRIFWDNKVGL